MVHRLLDDKIENTSCTQQACQNYLFSLVMSTEQEGFFIWLIQRCVDQCHHSQWQVTFIMFPILMTPLENPTYF